MVDIGGAAVPELVRALRHERAWLVATVLERLGHSAADALLFGVRSTNHQVRRYCAQVLGHMDDPRALPALWSLWDDGECGVRFAAREGLRRNGVELSVDQALDTLDGCSHGGHHVALDPLFRPFLDDQGVRSRLTTLLSVPKISSSAALLLALAGDEGVGTLARQLCSSNPEHVANAARAARKAEVNELCELAARRVLDRSVEASIRAAAAGA